MDLDPKFYHLSSVFPSNSSNSLPWNWVIETLAGIKELDASVLGAAILEGFPDLKNEKSGGSVRERIAVKYLEDWVDEQQRRLKRPLPQIIPQSLLPSSLSSSSSSSSCCRIDLNRSSEEVLLLLLSEKVENDVQHSDDQVENETGQFKHDLHQFILKKKSILPQHSVDLLKDSIGRASRLITFSQDIFFMPKVEEEYEAAKTLKVDIQDDHVELHRHKPVSALLTKDNGKEIQIEYPIGPGEQSNQWNIEEFHLLKQISSASADGICKEEMQVHCSGSGQHSPCQNDKLIPSQKFSVAQASNNGKEILQENPSRYALQSFQQKGEFQLPLQYPAIQSADGGKEILHEYPCRSGQQSCRRNASHCASRKLSGKANSTTVCNCIHVLETSVMPLPSGSKNKEVHTSGVSAIMDSMHWSSTVAADEPTMPKASSDVDGCHDPSCIFDKKIKMFTYEKNRTSHIFSKEDFMNYDGDKHGVCLKCDERGSLLICSGKGCLVAVHGRCIGPLVEFDEKGHFYCPLCSYIRATLEYYRVKKRCSQLKKALTSFMSEDSVRLRQRQLLHPAIVRKLKQARMVGNMSYHGKPRKCQENTKTSRINKQKTSTIHHSIVNLSGMADTCQSFKGIEVSYNTRESENERPVDDHDDAIQRQLKSQNDTALVLYKGKVPCSSVHGKVDIPPLHVTSSTGVVNDCRNTEMMEHQKTLTDDDMRESCQNVRDKHVVKDRATLDDNNLTCKESDITRIKEIHNVPQAKHCETGPVKACLEIPRKKNQEQADYLAEENMNNLDNRNTLSAVTMRKHAKRKLNMQINNVIVTGPQRSGTAKQQLAEATDDTANLTCEKGGTSRGREAQSLSPVNMKGTAVSDKFSEIQNKKHQKRAALVEQDPHGPCRQAAATTLTNKGNKKRKSLHTAVTHNQHPQLRGKKQTGGSSISNETKGKHEPNYEPNSRRSKQYWTSPEEKALKDAVQRFPPNNGRIPWGKICEAIRHTFREPRRPGDLKDKWRNILAKESREQERG